MTKYRAAAAEFGWPRANGAPLSLEYDDSGHFEYYQLFFPPFFFFAFKAVLNYVCWKTWMRDVMTACLVLTPRRQSPIGKAVCEHEGFLLLDELRPDLDGGPR